MDRLPVIAAVSICLCTCDTGQQSNPSAARAPRRVDAVLARASKKSWSDLCDVAPRAPSAFPWPGLNGGVAPQSGTRYRWVNVWASWCKPCVEELPLLTRTLAGWRGQGHPVALTLLSVDADPADAQRFLAARPELPPSLTFQDASTAPAWLAQLGLQAGTSIPVHLILDAQDKLLCARAGGIADRELDRFHKLLFP